MKTYEIHFEPDYAEMYEVYHGNGFEYEEAKEIVDAYNKESEERGHIDKHVFSEGGYV